ncbi:hypothetical protein LCGC14_3072220, partial [marine sediment metagenome]
VGEVVIGLPLHIAREIADLLSEKAPEPAEAVVEPTPEPEKVVDAEPEPVKVPKKKKTKKRGKK